MYSSFDLLFGPMVRIRSALSSPTLIGLAAIVVFVLAVPSLAHGAG